LKNFFCHGVNNKPKGLNKFLFFFLNFIFLWFRYKGVEVKDFTHSWQDGLAFNALIHKFRPDLFNYDDILQNSAARNLEHAFTIAKNIFKIDRYLDVEGIIKFPFFPLIV
jgi:hypothetical protein